MEELAEVTVCKIMATKKCWPCDAAVLFLDDLLSYWLKRRRRDQRKPLLFRVRDGKRSSKHTEKFDKEFTHDQVKNKYSHLRLRQRNFKNLVKETVIGYDSTTGKVEAVDEHWRMLDTSSVKLETSRDP